jgi:PAT family beta-lactamase induction signal transducer AmpG
MLSPMANTAPTPEASGSTPSFNPWLFVPVLYFMQAVPVTIVQEVSTVFYKDLGIANEPITRWTSLISLPWSLQLLLGPLVDLNGRKRQWILNGQLLIALGLCAVAFGLRLPNAFEITLLILGATAVTSALCNIATDGFYILAMSREGQAKFVGVQTTCYRLGRLFCVGILVLVVGILTRVPEIRLRAPEGQFLAFTQGDRTTYLREAAVGIKQGSLAAEGYGKLTPEVLVPVGTYGMRITPDGLIVTTVLGEQAPIPLSATTPPAGAGSLGGREIVGGPPLTTMVAPVSGPSVAQYGMNPIGAWSIVLLCAAGIYGLGFLSNRFNVPRPEGDAPMAEPVPGETTKNILRTVNLVALGVGGYFLINASLRLFLHHFGPVLQSWTGFDPHGWILKPDNAIIVGTFRLGFGATETEWFQLAICVVVVASTLYGTKRLIAGTAMGEALVSFVRQPGFPAIFAFVLFYRFGEAMVAKMSPLFLKDSIANGGLAMTNEQLGVVKGLIGVFGIILGGLAGGMVVAKFGLRRAFLPVALIMHIPNVLYAYAAWQGRNLNMGNVHVPVLGDVPMTLAGIDFTEQFGYGFGFAAYMVYLMWVAQRGKYKTTHYAIGTGMGALCIATAGAVSGVLQQNFGYQGFFVWALILAVPGILSLFFIPHD